MDPSRNHVVVRWQAGQESEHPQDLIAEEPLSIRVQGAPYAVVMRTPGDEKAHVAGFCLAEGIVDSPADIVALAFCDADDTNVVTVTLTDDRRKRVAAHLDRRSYISQTSCGLCGKELVQDLYQTIRPVGPGVHFGRDRALECLQGLSAYQPLRERTRAAHGAVILDADLQALAAAEDVGRHNALDKAVGRLFLDNHLDRAAVLVLSSRISYELVQKAARARIPVILAVSHPTALAVDLASRLNLTLASHAKGGGLTIYCNPRRLV